MKKLFRNFVHVLLGTKQFRNKHIKNFAKRIKNKKILEIGSGKKNNGKCKYSVKDLFDRSNEFIQSDIVPEFGYNVIDVTKMDYNNEFDVIICKTVLEHVYDVNKAVENMYNALKKGGVLMIIVPFLYPLHDEPNDYWRFTEYSLRKLLKKFEKIEINYSGTRKIPFTYYVEAIK